MTYTIILPAFSSTSCRRTLRMRSSSAFACLGLALSLLASTTPLAGELRAGDDMTINTRVALQQWPNAPSPFPSEHENLGDQTLQTIAEEASKHAQTKYLAKKFRKSITAVRKYVNLAWEEAERREGLAPELLIAIMQKESALRPKVQSRSGAQGLMQVIPRWHRDKLQPSESLFDPEVNVRVGADVLEEYLEQADGNLSKALRKYSGNTPGYANMIMKASRKLAELAEVAVAEANPSGKG